MRFIRRAPLTIFTLAFGYYHATIGLLAWQDYDRKLPEILTLQLYLVAITWAMLDRKSLKLSVAPTALALVAAALMPLLGAAAIGDEVRTGSETWYVVGVATLMAILAVRQRPVIAFIGTGAMILEVGIWGGIDGLLGSGIVGAILIVITAQAASRTIAQSEVAASTYLAKAISQNASQEAESAARQLAKRRIEQTLATALPVLELISSRAGKLTKSEKQLARLTEAGIRDQIRARAFQQKALVAAVREARSRGVEVQLLDDGGLEEISSSEKSKIFATLVEELGRVRTGKVVIRSVDQEQWKVTMVALQPGAEAPDVFLRL